MEAIIKAEKIFGLATRKKRVLAVTIIEGTLKAGMFILIKHSKEKLKIENVEIIDSNNTQVGLVFSEDANELLNNIRIGDILNCTGNII